PLALGFALSFDGLHAVSGDAAMAASSYTEALASQRQFDDKAGSGLSLGGLAQLASLRGDHGKAIRLYRESLAAFEAIGDRAEEARILSETAWTHLRNEDAALARRYFLESVQAYIEVASVRGVGLSLIGLAATETFEQRFETAVTLAAAAEVFAHEEGIVNVYFEEAPRREFVDRAREALSADEVARATEAGRSLTIKEA